MKKRIGTVAVALLFALASAYSQTTDLFELVETGTPRDVQAAIDKGADVKAQDKLGRTPLLLAAEHNPNPGVITVLLKAGADIEAACNCGITPLIGAAELNNHPEVITTLLKAGADAMTKSNKGKTAFDYAQDNEKLKGTDALKKLEEASR